MKTTMQELLDRLRTVAVKARDFNEERAKAYVSVISFIEENNLVDKTQTEIENAFRAGFNTIQWDKSKVNKANEYYNKTFNP